MKKINEAKYNLIVLSIISLLAFFIYLVSTYITENRTNAIKHGKYKLYSQNINDEVSLLIQNKQESTLSIALSLSVNNEIIKALQIKNPELNTLQSFSDLLKEKTQYKNVWFQVINKEGVSIFRSWTNKRGDKIVNARLDIAKMLKEPKIKNTISTGRFDMTFKSMVPVYTKDKKFIGLFEVITHFNSISKKLAQNGTNAIFLVDKKYKKQLTKSLTGLFVKDYYVANFDAKPRLMSYIEKQGVENIIKIKDYRIDEKLNKLITIYHIPDIHNKPMGYTVLFKDLNSFDMHEVEYVKQNIIFYAIISIFLLLIIGYVLVSKKHSKELDNKVRERTSELNNEKKYIQTILDTNPSIIVVTSIESNIQRANQRFFDFFGFESVKAFKEHYTCVCDLFVTLDNEPFPDDRMINGKLWCNYLAEDKSKVDHIVTLKFNEKLYYFTLSAIYLDNQKDILLTFQNVTDLKQKDKLLYEQSKMASMGEMIGNIAHQWRQPLSVISTSATGLLMQQEYNTLDEVKLKKACELINNNAQFLSTTIDDFKNFIKGDHTKKVFSLQESISQLLQIMNPVMKTNNIELIFNIQEDLKIEGYSNELLQCVMNIFNNAKDALLDIEGDERYIFLTAVSSNENVYITIKDNAGGIDEKIIGKIFEPYFTTKHKSQGTGLGLHMSYNMIVNGMGGKIEASNVQYTYKAQEHTGASFMITLPI